MHQLITNQGHVIAVRGTVLDVRFISGVPPIGARLQCELSVNGNVTAIVHSHLDQATVRAISVDTTRGLHRGDSVRCDGKPLAIPVGNQLLGRVIDLRGRPLDGLPAIESDVHWPLHRLPPPSSDRRPGGEVYPTGIKVIDMFCPFTSGGRKTAGRALCLVDTIFRRDVGIVLRPAWMVCRICYCNLPKTCWTTSYTNPWVVSLWCPLDLKGPAVFRPS
ncbi:MAG: hypothetical protein R3C28_26110 [Pirellulaceae bacterium]